MLDIVFLIIFILLLILLLNKFAKSKNNNCENYKSCCWFGCHGRSCSCTAKEWKPTIALNPFRQPNSSLMYVAGDEPSQIPSQN